MDARSDLDRLQLIVEQMGEAVLATTDTVEHLGEQVELLATEIHNQVQQQSYHIFAVSEAVQTLVKTQSESTAQIQQLTVALRDFVIAIKEDQDNS